MSTRPRTFEQYVELYTKGRDLAPPALLQRSGGPGRRARGGRRRGGLRHHVVPRYPLESGRSGLPRVLASGPHTCCRDRGANKDGTVPAATLERGETEGSRIYR